MIRHGVFPNDCTRSRGETAVIMKQKKSRFKTGLLGYLFKKERVKNSDFLGLNLFNIFFDLSFDNILFFYCES